VDVVDDLPVKVVGDPNHPISRGFHCMRGQAAVEYYDHPGRLNFVKKRVGARGEGKWATIAWDDALDEIAEKLKKLAAIHGPETLAYFFGTYHGTDQGAGVRFMNLFGSPNIVGNGFICAGPKIEAEWLTYGFGPAAPDPQPGKTKSILIWSQRSSSSNAPQWRRYLEAKRAGAKLVVVDPICIPEARVADVWLPIRQNTDAALALGLLHIIIRDGLYSESFVAEQTSGFEELRQRVAPFTPERVGEITGLSADLIGEVARIYADGPSIMSSGLPNGMGRNAVSFERAKCCLIAITGNLDRPGANKIHGPPDRVLSKADLELYDYLDPKQRAKRLGSDRFRLLNDGYEEINDAARKRWSGHRFPLTATRGALAHPPTVFRTILDRDPYPVTAAIVQHANLIGGYPNAGLVRQALASPNLELIAVQELFMTATTSYADYVLPASSWLEKSYMYVTGENKFVLAAERAVSPKFDRHSDYGFFRDLAQRFDQAGFWPKSLEALWDMMLSPANLTFSELVGREENWIVDNSGAGIAVGRSFGTASGKVELSSSILERCGYDPLPDYDDVGPSGNVRDYPLTLMTGATSLTMTHQDHRQIASLRKRHPFPTATIHPKTATELGFAKGEWVWIETPLGKIRQRLEVSDTIPLGTVDTERWWYPEWDPTDSVLYGVMESNANALASDEPEQCDRAYGTWPYRFARCSLSKATAPANA
jgi:anaerobic selenocysteine-containing dehydrogenase